jgi:hypothetical protein
VRLPVLIVTKGQDVIASSIFEVVAVNPVLFLLPWGVVRCTIAEDGNLCILVDKNRTEVKRIGSTP